MNELKRNGEGYMDPTAYKAIVEADKPVPGDIFSADGAEWLVVAYNAPVMIVLKLFDDHKNEIEVEVTSRAKKYTDPRFIHYRFYVPHSYDLVKALPQSEYESVVDAVRNVLGLPSAVCAPPVTIEKVVQVDGEETDQLRRECFVLKHELNVYKNLYNETLERLIAR